jgi:hypothetical protein
VRCHGYIEPRRAKSRPGVSLSHCGPLPGGLARRDSWLMSIPRSAKRSSTLRRDSGYRTYIITTRRMTSGQLLK